MPTAWLTSRAGQALLEQERLQVTQSLDRVFGEQIIQLGTWGPPGYLLSGARTQASFTLATAADEGVAALLSPERLPLLSDSIDAILLPHTLETSSQPHAVLREVSRVLRPGGKLLVLGFNPRSLTGLRHQLAFAGYPPGILRQISRPRLSDWLDLLNFTVDTVRPCYVSVASGRTLRWLQKSGWFAGAYQLLATRQSMPLTVIRPRLRRAPAMVAGVIKPSVRHAA